MDAFVVRAICGEIYPLINYAKLVQIKEISKFNFILNFYSRKNGEHNLLISAQDMSSRLHLTTKRIPSVKRKSKFTETLKKYLEGSIVTKIHSGRWERIVQISFISKSQESKSYALIIELFGLSSNILLLDGKTGKIIDSVKRVRRNKVLLDEKRSSPKYILPPLQDKKTLDQLDNIFIEKVFKRKRRNSSNLEWFQNILVENILGISPSFAKIISQNNKSLLQLLKQIRNSYFSCSFSPAIVFSENNTSKLLAYGELLNKPYKFQLFDRMNDAAEIYFSQQSDNFDLADKKKKLNDFLLSKIKRKEKTRSQIKLDIEKSKKQKEFKIRGDLVIANLQNISPKCNSFYVIKNDEKVHININPRYSVTQNAERYYRKYKKYKRMGIIAKKRLKMIIEEITYLKTIVLDIEKSKTINDFLDLENSSKFLELNFSQKREMSREKTEKAKPYFHFKFPEGYEIFAGKNSLGNEMILRNIGSKDDLWFHARDVSGSHILLRAEKKYIKKNNKSKMILQAASIAAFYCKSKESTKVRVSYLPFENLRRPKGSSFGKVVFAGHKTILATPEMGEKLVKSFRLKSSNALQ